MNYFINKQIGQRILNSLRMRNMTAHDLAEGLNLPLKYVTRLLRGTVSLSLYTVARVEWFLRIKLMDLWLHKTGMPARRWGNAQFLEADVCKRRKYS
jgi:transcriptional regulator with XRE-family HTH domain